MVELTALSPGHGLVPRTHGRVTVDELAFAPTYSLAPRPGAETAIAEVLGVALPPPGTVAEAGDVVLMPFAPGQFLLRGPVDLERLAPLARLTDQSDGWCWLSLEGPDAGAVLARLVALDLEAASAGMVAHVSIGHMNGMVWKLGPRRYRLAGFRSMAGTLVHELEAAMRAMAGRAAII